MAPQPEPEFSYPLDVANVPSAGGHYEIAASPEACARVAKRLDVAAVERLTASLLVKPRAGGLIHVGGHVHAEVVQACVVTLAPVKAVIDEAVEGSFITEAKAARKAAKPAAKRAPAREEAEEIVGLEDADPPDVAVDGRIDLGEFAVAQIALAIDPYPRAPGVSFNPTGWGQGAHPGAEELPPNPFAVLSKIKKPPLN